MVRVRLRIHYSRGGTLGVLLALMLLLVSTLIALTVDRARAITPGSLPGSSAAVVARQYYLSTASVTAPEATSACAAGYHFASIWEIADPSNLRYDTTLGLSSPDSGEGPPTAISFMGNALRTHGWVRTGYSFSTSDNTPGRDNCGNWLSNDSFHWGTVANLPSNWTGGEQDIDVWNTEVRTCNTHTRVWCVQDDLELLPEITVSPASLTFGNQGVDAGPTPAKMVTVSNVGDGDLHISSLSLTGAGASQFAIGNDSAEATLAPGGARTLQVSFDPSSPGTKSANLSIASDDGDEPTVSVPLSGNGLGSDVVIVWRVYLPLVLNSE